MTIEQRRVFLESRGFHPAAKSFAGKTGPLWFMVEGEHPRGANVPDSQRYYIDLATGDWHRWGSGTGPWSRLAQLGPGSLARAGRGSGGRRGSRVEC